MLESIKQKLPGRLGQPEYTTKVGVWRRRGDKFVFELHDAIRYRYEDRPNAHVLDTEEEIPAVPLEYVYTMADGKPYFEVVEIEDDQYAPREKILNRENFNANELEVDIEDAEIQGDNLVPLKTSIKDSNLEESVIDNKDTRLNFWLDHLKEKDSKYGAKGLLRENMNLILIIATALGVGMIMYTAPDMGQAAIDMMSTVAENSQEQTEILREEYGSPEQ